MKKIIIIILLITIILIFNIKYKNNSSIDVNEEDKVMIAIIDNKNYEIKLESNETVRELINLLPLELNMTELNGNEKYYYLDRSLKTSVVNPKRIEKGDIMLYQDNCLVIFYKSFNTTYSYTKIGHIDNLPDLGSKDILVKFIKQEI